MPESEIGRLWSCVNSLRELGPVQINANATQKKEHWSSGMNVIFDTLLDPKSDERIIFFYSDCDALQNEFDIRGQRWRS